MAIQSLHAFASTRDAFPGRKGHWLAAVFACGPGPVLSHAFERDRRDGQRLAAAGWKPIRTTWLKLKIRDGPVRTARTVVPLLQL